MIQKKGAAAQSNATQHNGAGNSTFMGKQVKRIRHGANNIPSKIFSALQPYCARLLVGLLSHDSRSTPLRLDHWEKNGQDNILCSGTGQWSNKSHLIRKGLNQLLGFQKELLLKCVRDGIASVFKYHIHVIDSHCAISG